MMPGIMGGLPGCVRKGVEMTILLWHRKGQRRGDRPQDTTASLGGWCGPCKTEGIAKGAGPPSLPEQAG